MKERERGGEELLFWRTNEKRPKTRARYAKTKLSETLTDTQCVYIYTYLNNIAIEFEKFPTSAALRPRYLMSEWCRKFLLYRGRELLVLEVIYLKTIVFVFSLETITRVRAPNHSVLFARHATRLLRGTTGVRAHTTRFLHRNYDDVVVKTFLKYWKHARNIFRENKNGNERNKRLFKFPL